MTASPYLSEDDDEDYTEDEHYGNEQKLAVTGLAQNSLPHRPRHAMVARPLQERSHNIQGGTIPQPRRPLSEQDIPRFYDRGPGTETKLTNKAGDFVLIHAQFYQLTAVQCQNYEWLCSQVFEITKYKKYRKKENNRVKRKGDKDVWPDIREELFFKGMYKCFHVLTIDL